MNRKFLAFTFLLVGIFIGYTLHWLLSERFERNSWKKSIGFVNSDEGTKLFDALKKAGVNQDEVNLAFDDSTLRIRVNISDDRVDSLVEMLKDVAPAHSVSLEVRSERGGVFFLPEGAIDFRDVMVRLSRRETTRNESGR
ncbi:hypothetical protein [Roseibacillus ishigakijimensis]|uniref:Uncharacterized protein n=1 Tax=Roseibacillus ishigakijimensis TaxID=454146 RepID=A0A934VME9_9BACT|nr:hypothetical protein [Roseibacillus ishigakijimensis]MBK1835684.1 hypothetical protein [Roseibacillus ishigakijimensis]